MVAPIGAVCLHVQVLTRSSSFKCFICTLFEKLNSKWHEISISPHSCLQCRLPGSPVTKHFDTVFFTTCKKMPHYSGELARQLAGHFIALHYSLGVFVQGVVKLSFRNQFFSDFWLLYIFKHDIHAPKLMRNSVKPSELERFLGVYCLGFTRWMTAWLLSKRFVSFSCSFIL